MDERDLRSWPLAEHGRTVIAGGMRWQVTIAGQGPVLLFVHGTGASSHTWRALLPRLMRSHTVVAPDLPSQGRSQSLPPAELTIGATGRRLAALLESLGLECRHGIGHSAGAAILAHMALEGRIAPRGLIAINGAFMPFGGAAHSLFAPLAGLMAANGLIARTIAHCAASPAAVGRIIAATGSRLDADGTALYSRLLRDPAHVAGTLGMMSRWDLHSLCAELPRLGVPLALLVGTRDIAVPPHQAEWIRRRLPGTTLRWLSGLGHLAHEESPETVLAEIEPLIATA
ncbi:MAG: alpha/beta fold hydrolase [Gammaproteobacteria bacterium]|nr:alpha/beta fold hydrolase [Gammaproteobacteria bacterium]